jgi:integrase
MAVLAFLFAIETAMRSGEILGLSWADVHPRHVVLPKTKNGDSREVPLSPKAREILAALRGNEKPFDIANGTRDALFRKLVVRAGIANLTFHDSRAQAIYQLSKKLGIMDLARVIGHRDLKSLMIYYNESADALADRL